MFHVESTLKRIKTMLSDEPRNSFLKKYNTKNFSLFSSTIFDASGLDLVSQKLDMAVKQNLLLISDRLINVFENEDLFEYISDELKQYLILNIWAARVDQSINENDIPFYVQNLIDVVSDKESSESYNVNEIKEKKVRKVIYSVMNLPRHDNQDAPVSLMSKRKDIPKYSLPFNTFISVYESIDKELKNIKGKRKFVDDYKSHKSNHSPERRLYNRFYDYFDACLLNLPNREILINKVLFEREYNLVLASQINMIIKDLPDSSRDLSRRVLSLAALLPIVEGRLVLIEQFKNYLLHILEGSGLGPLQLSPSRDTLYDSILKFATDLLSMALIVLPVMELNLLSILEHEEQPILEELSYNEPIHLKMNDVEDIDKTLIEINHVQAIYNKNKLWDVQSLLEQFLVEDLNSFLDEKLLDDDPILKLQIYLDSSIMNSNKIESLGKRIREKYFGKFLKFNK
jgi:hypothetical protein